GTGATKAWPHRSGERAANAGLDRAAAARAIWRESPLPPALFDFWQARLRPRERYYVQARPAGKLALDRPLLVRSYAAYWLLPAIQVREPALADAIVSYRADPRALGLP